MQKKILEMIEMYFLPVVIFISYYISYVFSTSGDHGILKGRRSNKSPLIAGIP